MPQHFSNQKGITPFILLIIVFGLIVFILLANTSSFKSQIFDKLFAKPASQAAQDVTLADQQFWLIPDIYDHNDPLARKTPADYPTFWDDENQLQDVLSKTKVFGFYELSLMRPNGPQDLELQKAIPMLAKYHVKVDLEIGGVNGSFESDCQNHTPGERGAQDAIQGIQKIESLGGHVDYLEMDDPIARSIQYGDYGSPCNYTPDEAVQEVIDAMKGIHAVYPTIKIGMDYNFPNRTYNGIKPYWGSHWSLYNIADYKDITDKLFAKAQQENEHIEFINVDTGYTFATGNAPLPDDSWYHNPTYDPKSIDWMQRIVDLEHQVKSHGILFGIMLNSSNMSVSNQGFQSDVLAYIDAYKAKGGSPDIWDLEAFGAYPDKMLPVSQSFTFMNTSAKVIQKIDNLPITYNDIKGRYDFLYTKISGAAIKNTYHDIFNIDSTDLTTGVFSGSGYDADTPSTTFSLTGEVIGRSLSYHLTQRSSNYTDEGVATINSDGSFTGTDKDSIGNTFKFTATLTTTQLNKISLNVEVINQSLFKKPTTDQPTQIKIAWRNNNQPTSRDWLGVYNSSSDDQHFLNWIYTSSCSQQATNKSLSTGSCTINLPSNAQGSFQVRYFSNDGFTKLGSSKPLSIQ